MLEWMVTIAMLIDIWWLVGLVWYRFVRDLPMGPINPRLKGEAYTQAVQRNIEINYKILHFWRKRLGWIVLVLNIAAFVILVAVK